MTEINNVYVNGSPQAATGWSGAYPNSLTFNTAPASGALISADFVYAFVCRFASDTQEFEEFMASLWRVSSLKFHSVKGESSATGSIPFVPNPPAFPLIFTLGMLPANIYGSGGANATYINNAGLIAYGGAPRLDFTGGTSALLVEAASTNLLSYSSNFAGTFWTETGLTAATNAATAPDGTSTAQSLTDSAANSVHRTISSTVAISDSADYSLSGYLKYSNHQYVCICLQDGSVAGDVLIANLDLFNGTVRTSVQGTTTLVSASITAAGNGWWRFALVGSINGTAGTAIVQLYFANSSTASRPSYAGTGSDVVFAWGFQLEAASAPSSYIATNGAAVTRTADAVTFTLPPGKSTLTFTFSDGTQQTVSGFTGGSTVTVPNDLNESRIAQIQAA